MKKQKIFAVAVFAATLLGMCSGCGGTAAQDSEVSIGYFNNITHAQALLMKAEGTLEEAYGEQATVKWTAFNAGPAEQEALFSGDIDIGYIGPVPAITANAKSDGDVQILCGASKGGAILVTGSGSEITGVSDLAGKTVAIPQIGNTQHLCLLQLLDENGLSPVTDGGTVTVSAISNADVANTMERGDIDAALVPEPWGATLLAQGADMVLDYDEIYLDGQYDVAVVVVRREFMEEHPELVEAFLKAHEEATQELNDNPQESQAIVNEELQTSTGKSLDDAILTDAFSRIQLGTELNTESIAGFAQISSEQGFIDAVPSDEQLYAD